MDDNLESVDVTDETNTTITYYSEKEVIEMKNVSYWIGAITWFIFGMCFTTLICSIVG